MWSFVPAPAAPPAVQTLTATQMLDALERDANEREARRQQRRDNLYNHLDTSVPRRRLTSDYETDLLMMAGSNYENQVDKNGLPRGDLSRAPGPLGGRYTGESTAPLPTLLRTTNDGRNYLTRTRPVAARPYGNRSGPTGDKTH